MPIPIEYREYVHGLLAVSQEVRAATSDVVGDMPDDVAIPILEESLHTFLREMGRGSKLATYLTETISRLEPPARVQALTNAAVAIVANAAAGPLPMHRVG
jgi:hypothetical protein